MQYLDHVVYKLIRIIRHMDHDEDKLIMSLQH